MVTNIQDSKVQGQMSKTKQSLSESLPTQKMAVNRHANLRDKKSGRPTGRGLWGPPTPPIGVRGDAPVGAQGAKPPEAPGFMRILK